MPDYEIRLSFFIGLSYLNIFHLRISLSKIKLFVVFF